MAVDLTATYTITAPAGVDGRGAIAIVNGDPTAANFVGYLVDSSGFDSPEIRASDGDPVVEGDGVIQGANYYGGRPFTLEINVAIAATSALSMARLDKLYQATNAMRADGTIVWTEAGSVAKVLNFRRQEPIRGPSTERKCLFAGVSANPRILANAESSSAPTSGMSNAGNMGTLPRFTFTSAASGTVTLSRTSPSPTESLTLAIGGTSGLAASTATTVDFAAKTVYQGSTNRYSAVNFPSSVWWEMQPGSNTITASGASSVTVFWRSAWL